LGMLVGRILRLDFWIRLIISMLLSLSLGLCLSMACAVLCPLVYMDLVTPLSNAIASRPIFANLNLYTLFLLFSRPVRLSHLQLFPIRAQIRILSDGQLLPLSRLRLRWEYRIINFKRRKDMCLANFPRKRPVLKIVRANVVRDLRKRDCLNIFFWKAFRLSFSVLPNPLFADPGLPPFVFS